MCRGRGCLGDVVEPEVIHCAVEVHSTPYAPVARIKNFRRGLEAGNTLRFDPDIYGFLHIIPVSLPNMLSLVLDNIIDPVSCSFVRSCFNPPPIGVE